MADEERQDYPLDNDDEAKRLSDQHAVIKSYMNGKLIMAPIDLSNPNLRVLDSGTADGRFLDNGAVDGYFTPLQRSYICTGTWLLDVRNDVPSSVKGSVFIGTDINASRFPTTAPEGVSFHIQNILDPWPAAWQNSFDLVH